MAANAQPRETTPTPNSSAPLPTLILRTLLACYYPFVALIVILNGAAIAGLGLLAYYNRHLSVLLALAILVLALTFLQLLWALRVLFLKIKDFNDEMELRVPRDMAPKLYDWVESIARERGLPMPDDIRVAADTVAHVYQRVNGQQVLVFGGGAVRVLPQPVLAGIVAHELAHLAAGDTELGRRALRRQLLMRQLEMAFHIDRDYPSHLRWDARNPLSSLALLGATLNPAVWALRLYHLLYALAHTVHSWQCEYAADQLSLEQSGAKVAAQALIVMTVVERMPWIRMSSLAENWVATNQPAHLLFQEQERAARSMSPGEWQDAIRKELKRETGIFASHPSLKQRLKALGISPKKAQRLLPELSGPAAYELFGAWWPKLEKQLAERLLVPYREAHLAKMEVGEVFSALRKLDERSR
ncbi:MAG TPA: M48 family metalloprotease [Gemmataceae bacterium]